MTQTNAFGLLKGYPIMISTVSDDQKLQARWPAYLGGPGCIYV